MKPEPYIGKLPLTGASIDQISEKIEEYLNALEMERANVLRIRLSLEEALLRWRDRFGEKVFVTLELGTRWHRPTITLSLPGDSFDPLSASPDELGSWADTLLSNVGLLPRYSYTRGVNVLQLRLSRKRLNPAIGLLISGLAGIFTGLLGRAILSESARQGAVLMILSPLREGFIRILNTTASPVVFLSVLAAVCNVGSMAAMGKSGRHLLRRFLLLSTAMAAVTLIISSLIFQPQKTADLYSGGFHFGLLLDFILQFIPSGPISPLVEGDFPQLVLLALVLGTALLAAGARAGGLVSIVHEANSVGLLISGWVNRMAPFFIAVLLLLGVWDGSLAGLTGLWQPLAMFLLLCAVFLFLYLLRVGRKFRLPIKRLIRKMKDSFLIAFRNSSVDASYGANQLCCERRLGIDRKLTSFGLPLGLVIYMPAGTIAITLVTVYAARAYDVQVSSLWYIMTIFLTVALQAATPPMAGVGLLSYIVILSRLGIPTEALTVAMIADILFGFAVAAVDQAMLQLELLLEADRLDLLNRDVLKK